MSSWFEHLFCGRITSERNRLIRELDGAIRDRDDFSEKYEAYKAKYVESRDELSIEKKGRVQAQRDLRDLTIKTTTLERKTESLLEDIDELEEKLDKATQDSNWYESRMRTLENALNDTIILPEIELTEDDLTPYRFKDWPFSTYDTKVADAEYYLLPYDKWLEILTPIQKEVKKAVGSWKPNISDCDDFAYIMGASVTLFFINAQINRQGAFMVVWDITGEQRHAYNAFMDNTQTVWIYEPQNGSIIGKLGETTGAYETNWIWYLGGTPP